jgi:hypothetical protein
MTTYGISLIPDAPYSKMIGEEEAFLLTGNATPADESNAIKQAEYNVRTKIINMDNARVKHFSSEFVDCNPTYIENALVRLAFDEGFDGNYYHYFFWTIKENVKILL